MFEMHFANDWNKSIRERNIIYLQHFSQYAVHGNHSCVCIFFFNAKCNWMLYLNLVLNDRLFAFLFLFTTRSMHLDEYALVWIAIRGALTTDKEHARHQPTRFFNKEFQIKHFFLFWLINFLPKSHSRCDKHFNRCSFSQRVCVIVYDVLIFFFFKLLYSNLFEMRTIFVSCVRASCSIHIFYLIHDHNEQIDKRRKLVKYTGNWIISFKFKLLRSITFGP